MPTLLVTLFVLLATALATPAAAQLDGTWELEHVNGAPLPANSPSEDGVVMEGLTVTLDAQAKYTIVLKARNSATGVPSVVEMTGTYRMEENRLHFQPDPGSTATPVDFHWEMDEGRLIWRDERVRFHAPVAACATAPRPPRLPSGARRDSSPGRATTGWDPPR